MDKTEAAESRHTHTACDHAAMTTTERPRGYWHIVLLLALRVHKEGRYDYKRCLDRQGGHVLPSSPYLLIERTSKQQSGSTSQQLLPLFSIKRL